MVARSRGRGAPSGESNARHQRISAHARELGVVLPRERPCNPRKQADADEDPNVRREQHAARRHREGRRYGHVRRREHDGRGRRAPRDALHHERQHLQPVDDGSEEHERRRGGAAGQQRLLLARDERISAPAEQRGGARGDARADADCRCRHLGWAWRDGRRLPTCASNVIVPVGKSSRPLPITAGVTPSGISARAPLKRG